MGDLFSRLALRARSAMPAAQPRHASRFETAGGEATAPPTSPAAMPGAGAGTRELAAPGIAPAAPVEAAAVPPAALPEIAAASLVSPAPGEPPAALAAAPSAPNRSATIRPRPLAAVDDLSSADEAVPDKSASPMPEAVAQRRPRDPSAAPPVVAPVPPAEAVQPAPTLVPHPAAARIAPVDGGVSRPMPVAEAEGGPVVRVSIGSVEVRAPAAAPPPVRPASRLISLDDYLRGDVRGRR